MKRNGSADNRKEVDDAERVVEPVATAKGRNLLTIAVVVIIGALFAPTGGFVSTVLNFGWILAFCLFAAVVMIVFAARDVGQLRGFAGLVFFSVVFRQAVAVVSVKMLFYHGTACRLLDNVGDMWASAGGGPIWTITAGLIFGAIVAAGWAVSQIIRQAGKVAVNSIPYKFISTDADMNAGLISENQAEDIKQRITDEARFYLSTAAVSKLLLFDVIMSVVFVLAAGAGIAFYRSSVMAENIAMGPEGVEIGAIATVSLVPAAVTVILCAWLVRKKDLELSEAGEAESDRGFDMHESEVERGGAEMEVLNPDFVQKSLEAGPYRLDVMEEAGDEENDLTATPEDGEAEEEEQDLAAVLGEALGQDDSKGASGGMDEADGGEISVDVEQAGRETGADADSTEAEHVREDEPGSGSEEVDVYDAIAEFFRESSEGEAKVLLLGGTGVENMPVTEVVNAGFHMAGEGSRCLVIDADIDRRAVAEAFDAEGAEGASPALSCVDNLWVWTVKPEVGNLGVDIANKIEAERRRFGRIIIYAPAIRDDAYFGKLAGMVDAAVLAGDVERDEYMADLKGLLEAMGCRCF
ncbi:type III secretion system protein [Anaerohalosphaera lusitana]|uniref:Type III secretion system protein n=1 Tax=Anaerohalosphaera lusitana TaxID=1936003 RepID=A0A1U9NG50_9BACT|nr:FHIPEP family type III secretion protein [Anaerohalosphaera lusitana]AQT66909.1 type III secretion system protein [Anaerohalosphaera lusitana]